MLYILNSNSQIEKLLEQYQYKFFSITNIDFFNNHSVTSEDILICFIYDNYQTSTSKFIVQNFKYRNIIITSHINSSTIGFALDSHTFDLFLNDNYHKDLPKTIQSIQKQEYLIQHLFRKNLLLFISEIIQKDFSLISEFLKFIELNTVMLLVHNTEGKIKYVSENLKTILGIKALTNISVNDIIEDSKNVKIQRLSLQNKEIFKFEGKLYGKDKKIPVIIVSSHLKNNKHLQDYTLLELIDISEKTLYYEKLNEFYILTEAFEKLIINSLDLQSYSDLLKLFYKYAQNFCDINKAALFFKEGEHSYLLKITNNQEVEEIQTNTNFEINYVQIISQELNTDINNIYIYENFAYKKSTMLFLAKNKKFTKDELFNFSKFNSIFKLVSKYSENLIQLKSSENKFRSLIENSVDIIIKLDKNYNVIFINKANKFWNLDLNEIIGKNISEFGFNKHYEQIIKSAIDNTFANKPLKSFNIKLKIGFHKQQRIFNWKYYPEKDFKGNVTAVVAIGRDITDLDSTIKLLVDRTVRESLVINSLFDAIVITDQEGRITQLNKAAIKLWGYTNEESKNKFPHQLFHKDKSGVLQEFVFSEVMQKGIWKGEIYYFAKTGKEGVVEATISQLTNAKNEVIGTIGVHRDITKQKEQNKILRETLRKYQMSMQASPLGILLIKPNGDIFEVNDAAVKIMGSPSAEATKQLNLFTLQTSIDAGISENLKKVIEKRIPLTEQKLYKTTWGKETYLRYHFSPYVNPETNKLEFVQAMIEDLSEIKKEQDEKEKLQLQLNQAKKLESIGKLAGGIAHDFNNLLTAIQLNLSFAIKEIDPNDKIYEYLKNIEDTSVRTSNLVKQLLAYGRKQVVQKEMFSFKKKYYEFKSMLSSLIGEHIIIEEQMNIQDDYIHVDPNQLEQIIINLFVNARDAMPNGGKIIVSTKKETITKTKPFKYFSVPKGDYIKIKIRDTGKGMDKEILDKIFEPFFTTKSLEKGTGLGLASVYGSIKQMNGYIDVWSKPNEGTEFTLYFEHQKEVLNLQNKITSNKTTITHTAVSNKKFVILVVEDEKMIRKLTVKILKRKNFEVYSAENGAKALEIIKNQKLKPDLLITDLLMPQMNGNVLAQKLLDIYPNTKILLSSGYSEDLIKNKEQFKFDFISKPYSSQTLINKIYQVLNI